MKRTISAMVGKGSVNHNSRKFKAENVDSSRTHLNIDYCNEDIKEVYHKLFDKALEKYNARQTRSDRMIENYYNKIRTGKQEKPFYEIILQIGDKDTMNAKEENADIALKILDEYYSGFSDRNPNLYVFSAHIHMDEATPHIHIDFVPFITGSKRGLETRVSLKQALGAQGFKGGSRGDTEWNQWVQSEKEQLAEVMKLHGIEWEQKGTHEKHLSVLEFKKQERVKELEKLDEKLVEHAAVHQNYDERIKSYDDAIDKLDEMKAILETPEYQLPDPSLLMSAKNYKIKIAETLVEKYKLLVQTSMSKCFRAVDDYQRMQVSNSVLRQENERLIKENDTLREENKDYINLKRAVGKEKLDSLIEEAQTARKDRVKNRINGDFKYER